MTFQVGNNSAYTNTSSAFPGDQATFFSGGFTPAATGVPSLCFLRVFDWQSASNAKVIVYKPDGSVYGTAIFSSAQGTDWISSSFSPAGGVGVVSGVGPYKFAVVPSDGANMLIYNSGNGFECDELACSYAIPPTSLAGASGGTKNNFNVYLDGSAGDTTAPSLTDGPNAINITGAGFDITGTPDEGGTASLVIVTPGAAATSDATFDASIETAAMTAATQFTIHHTS